MFENQQLMLELAELCRNEENSSKGGYVRSSQRSDLQQVRTSMNSKKSNNVNQQPDSRSSFINMQSDNNYLY